jgi:hypothetical protein
MPQNVVVFFAETGPGTRYSIHFLRNQRPNGSGRDAQDKALLRELDFSPWRSYSQKLWIAE